MKLFVFTFIIFINSVAFAEDPINYAKVVLVRGKASKLLPNTKLASPVKKGDMLPEDTSIVTQAKSIVRITFPDKSSVNIGPNSKLVVSKIPKDKANMLNLLNGAIKSAVEKDNLKAGNKMIIKTRSAVMGVRGTKFQATYNPINKNTSLVTIEGKVAMARVTNKIPTTKIVEEKTKDITQKSVEKSVEKSVMRVATPDEELELLDNVLDSSKDVVEVKQGRYSGVIKNLTAPTKPVKIAPLQYDAIAKSMDSKKTAEEVMKTSVDESSSEVAAEVAAESATTEASASSSSQLSLRPGGFVDFDTGLYVAPPEDSNLNELTGTFEAKEDIGTVDEVTGDYIPPKGVELDAQEGFIIKQVPGEKVALADDQKLKQTLEVLNKEVKKQVDVNKIETEETKDNKWWSPEKHKIAGAFAPFSEYLKIELKNGSGDVEAYSAQASKIIVDWEQKWSEKLGTHLSLGNVNLDWDDSDFPEYTANESSGGYFAIGGIYRFKRLTLTADYVREPYFFVYGESNGTSTTVYGSLSEFDYLHLIARYFAYDWKAFKVYLKGSLQFYGSDEVNVGSSSLDGTSLGYSFGADANYDWTESLSLSLSGRINILTSEFETATLHKIQFGTAANLVWTL